MRIPARWAWIPLALTVAGVVYLSMVKIAAHEAASREPQVVRTAPKVFVAPPVVTKTVVMPEAPPLEMTPVHPPAPVLPTVKLPPFHQSQKQ